MINRMEIKEQILDIIAECLEINKEQIDCDTELADINGFDSMRNVMILSQIEEAFDVMIPEDDIFDLTSVNEWVEEIKKLKK